MAKKKIAFYSGNLRQVLLKVYKALYKVYGPQHWWPAHSRFEVMVGAILTQNTNWSNVKRAIANLRKEKLLSPLMLHRLGSTRLASLIRPSGYYNIKAERLKNFLEFLFVNYNGEISLMKRRPLEALRKEVLNINGIGPETADSILLYALNKPVFVIDAYTRRIMECLGIAQSESTYESLQRLFMQNLPRDTELYNEYHALLVTHSKTLCKAKPDCEKCLFYKGEGA